MKHVDATQVDFYGDQAMNCARAAAQMGNERTDLMNSLEAEAEARGEHSVGQAFGRYMVRRFLPGEKEPKMFEEIAEFAIHWLCSGLPRIVLSHRHAASLATTRIPLEFCDTIKPPWNYFMVVVPERLLFNPVRSSILCMPVHMEGGREGCRILFQHWSSPGQDKPRARQYAVAPWSEFAQMPEDVGTTMHAELRRSLEWHMRLVFGCCVEMQGKSSEQLARPVEQVSRELRSGLPTAWNLSLSRPVRVDVRKHCREWIAGSGRKLDKQFVVAGHWKQQPCGPSRSERKFIHIEPYWRGPKDAPIAVRPHILKGPKDPKDDGRGDGGSPAAPP